VVGQRARRVEGVEPTNNLAERAQRTAVIWRKGSFGTWSAAGSTFVDRVLTTIGSLKQQGRHALAFVTEALVAGAHREGPFEPLSPASNSHRRPAATRPNR